jgi:alkanesulfonate monooxygenase
MTEKRQMHLGWLMHASGIHPALHPNVPLDHANSLGHYVEMARIAEAAKLDFLFQADAAGARDGNMNALKRNPTFMNILEPVTLLSVLAGYTEKIGLGATVSTSYWEPYNLARQFASLDHLSGGRSGWNVVTSAHPAGTPSAIVARASSSRRLWRFGTAGTTTPSCSIPRRGSISIRSGCTI